LIVSPDGTVKRYEIDLGNEKTNIGALLRKDDASDLVDKVLADIDVSEFGVAVTDALREELEQAFRDAGVAAFEAVRLGADDRSIVEQLDPLALSFAQKRAAELVGMKVMPDGRVIENPNAAWSINDTTRDALRAAVSNAVSEGYSVADLAEDILTDIGDDAPRAEMIARTELAFAHTNGNLEGWRQSGVVTGKRWVMADTHPEEDECDEAAAEGVIGLDDAFDTTGTDGPPAHPNCLCDVLPVLAEEEKAHLGQLLKDWDEDKHPRDEHGRFSMTGRTSDPEGRVGYFSPEKGGFLFHGTREPGKKLKAGQATFTTLEFDEAKAFARGAHLGGRGRNPSVVMYEAKPGKMVDVSDKIEEMIMEGGPEDEKRIYDEARRSGARYATFVHPGVSEHVSEAPVIVSLHPHKDLKSIGWQPIFDEKRKAHLGLLRKAKVDQVAHSAATSNLNLLRQPTQAQRKVGNYPKGHARIAGLEISIENPAGSTRNPAWPALTAHYGYIRRTEGADGDHVDVFVKPETAEDYAGPVFVIDQKIDGQFDEHKCMIGWDAKDDASQAYLSNYEYGWPGLGRIRQFSVDEFKGWLAQGPARKVNLSRIL
jgi:hypothetical protein